MDTYKLLFKESPKYIQPESYLRAISECIFFMLVAGGIVSYLYTPEIFTLNPLKERLGYNNFCVGIDAPPGKYFSLPFAILAVYFCIQFNIYDHLRTKIIDTEKSSWKSKFSIIANNFFIVSIVVFVLCLMVTPMDNVWAHLLLFVQVIFFMGLVHMANYFEYPNPELSYTIYNIVLVAVSFLLSIFYIFNFYNYDLMIAQGYMEVVPLIPKVVVQTLDYIWFFCLFTYAFFVPNGEKIKVHYFIK